MLRRTVFEEEIGALEEKIVWNGWILVGKESQNGRPVERNASSRWDLTAVTAAKRRMNQIDRLRIGNLRVEIDIFVTAPGITIKHNISFINFENKKFQLHKLKRIMEWKKKNKQWKITKKKTKIRTWSSIVWRRHNEQKQMWRGYQIATRQCRRTQTHTAISIQCHMKVKKCSKSEKKIYYKRKKEKEDILTSIWTLFRLVCG